MLENVFRTRITRDYTQVGGSWCGGGFLSICYQKRHFLFSYPPFSFLTTSAVWLSDSQLQHFKNRLAFPNASSRNETFSKLGCFSIKSTPFSKKRREMNGDTAANTSTPTGSDPLSSKVHRLPHCAYAVLLTLQSTKRFNILTSASVDVLTAITRSRITNQNYRERSSHFL